MLRNRLYGGERILDPMVELGHQKLLRLLGLLALGNITGSPEPLGDLAVSIENRQGARVGPSQAPIDADDPMFQLEDASPIDSIFDASDDVGLVVGMDVLCEPALAWIQGVSNEILAVQVAHLGPIRTHPIHHVPAGCDKGAKAFLARAQRPGRLAAVPRHPEMSVDASEQLASAERLGEVVVCAGPHAVKAAFLPGTCRQKDDRYRACPPISAQFSQQLNAVE